MNSGTAVQGVDFHCHVDLHPDPPAFIRECKERRIAVLAATTTPKAWSQNHKWTRDCNFVHAAVGLHPELVERRFSEIELLEEVIADSRLVGEVGLDGSSQHWHSYSRQREVFERALISSQRHGGRVVTIHSRLAVEDVMRAIEDHTSPSRVLCILHWFSGSLSELRRATELGCYFSVNSAMLRHDRGVKIVRSISKDRLLTETDFPFITVNGRKSEPWDIIDTCEKISKIFKASYSDTKQQLMRNAEEVFQFAGIYL